MTPAGNRGANKRAMAAETKEKIIGFIEAYIEYNGYAPTNKEIAEGIEMSMNTVRLRLHALEREGSIKRGRGSRAIIVT